MWGCARVRDLTRHVHHPAVAHSQDLVGLAEQPAGADAVRVVSWEPLLAAGAAVPPGLGQVGQLSTQTFIRPPSSPARPHGCRGGDWEDQDPPSAPDMKRRSGNPERRRSPAGGCRGARPDCGSALGFRPPGRFRLHGETLTRGGVLCKRERSREFETHASAHSCGSVRGRVSLMCGKGSHGGSLSCDGYTVSTARRRLIWPRNFPFQIRFPASLCNQKRH